jgi:DNA end-binding protein Ku
VPERRTKRHAHAGNHHGHGARQGAARPGRDDAAEAARRRALWSGTLTFGLVSIPVDLYPGVRNTKAPLHMLDSDGTPLARRFHCPDDDEGVPQEHLVRGFEVGEGRYVVVTDDELEALDPKKSREIDLRLFVDRRALDPMYFDHPYFLVPASDSGKAYALLARVMESTDRAGIATFVMRDREYLVAIFADGGVLRALTLRFHDEVRSLRDVGLSKSEKPPAALVKKLEHAVAGLRAGRLPTAELTDDRADAIRELAEKKRKRRADVVHTDAPTESSPGADVIDLMAVLRKSLEKSGTVKASKTPARSAGHVARRHGKRQAGGR